MIRLPFGIGRNEIIFALKAYVAAVAALWIALQLNLEKPYWAMGTAYVVMQPMAAAVTSKAVFRVMGTFLGAIAAVVMVPNLVAAPELLCLALASWVGLCLFVSLFDRTPRAYVAMLAGYTCAIIAFMSVATPDAVFEIALSRTEEIVVGILCASVVARLVMPRHLGPQLAARLDAWMTDAGRWAGDVLSGRPDPHTSERDRRRLATDTVDMLALTTHLPYDTSDLRHVAGQVRELQQQMTALLPILSSLGDRLVALRGDVGLDARVSELLEAVAAWIAGEAPGAGTNASELRRRIAELEAARREEGDCEWCWRDLLVGALLERLSELVKVWDNCLCLRVEIAGGQSGRPRFRGMVARYAGDPGLHVNASSAALAGFAAAVGILVCCAFWIITGWHEGAGAAQMAAIFLSLFAVMDNPVPVMRLFARYSLYAIVAVGLLQFLVLPYADSFLELVVLSAPYLLVFGSLMATPKWGPLGFLMCVNLPFATMLDSHLNVDLAAYINGNIAAMLGIVTATSTAALLTAVGAERGIARLLRANSSDLAHIAEGRGSGDRMALVRRMVDRFGLLVQRHLLIPQGRAPRPEFALLDLRVGLNIADLVRVSRRLPPLQRQRMDELLSRLAAYFRNRGADAAAVPPVEEIDRVLAVFADRRDGAPAVAVALGALVGLRCALAPDAPEPVVTAPDHASWSPAA